MGSFISVYKKSDSYIDFKLSGCYNQVQIIKGYIMSSKVRTERNTVGAIAGLVPCSGYLVRRFADSGHLDMAEDYNGWRIFPYPEQAVATLRELLAIDPEVDCGLGAGSGAPKPKRAANFPGRKSNRGENSPAHVGPG